MLEFIQYSIAYTSTSVQLRWRDPVASELNSLSECMLPHLVDVWLHHEERPDDVSPDKGCTGIRTITCLLWSLYINDLCDWPAGVKLQRSHIYTGLSSEYSTITLSSRLLILTSVSSCVEVRLYSFIRMWNSRHFLPCVKLFPARWNCPCLHFLESILSDSGIYLHTDILENNINFSHLNAYNKQQTF